MAGEIAFDIPLQCPREYRERGEGEGEQLHAHALFSHHPAPSNPELLANAKVLSVEATRGISAAQQHSVCVINPRLSFLS